MTPPQSPLPWTVHGYTIRDAIGDPVAHQVFPEDGNLIVTAPPLQGSEMTSPDYGDLVRRLRYGRACDGLESLPDWYRLCTKAADALEQQAREVAAREGALRNSGNMVRALNAEVLQLRKKYDRLCFELNSRGIPLPGEPSKRGTGYAGEEKMSDVLMRLKRCQPVSEVECIEVLEVLSRDLAAARREKEEVLAAFEQLAFKGCRALSDNADLRREKEELRERTIEEFKRQVFALCEETEEKYHAAAQMQEGKEGAFARGRCVEAKSIRNAIVETARALSAQPDPHKESKPTAEELQQILDSDPAGNEAVFSKPDKVFDNIGEALAYTDAQEAQPERNDPLKAPEHKSMTETLMNQDEKRFWDAAEKDGGK